MIEWQDEAVLLGARPHGEAGVVVQLLTRDRGRYAGLVRGGQSRRLAGVLQPGNRVQAVWRARLSEHLGGVSCELEEAVAARFLEDPERLAALRAATAVCEQALPEREPHPGCYEGLLALIAALAAEHWGEAYVFWEVSLLKELGFGLDLSQCAGGGADELAYVSPRSGRAVSLSAGAPYRDRLLALPGFLVGRGSGGRQEVSEGLALTGRFLEQYIFHPQNRPLPSARHRLAEGILNGDRT